MDYQIKDADDGFWIYKDGQAVAWESTYIAAQQMIVMLKSKEKFFKQVKYGRLNNRLT